jgi:hypothetical protein
MASARVGFELLLLERMLESYRASVLAGVGLTRKEVAALRANCSLQHPEELTADVDRLKEVLGSPARSEPVMDAPEPFVGSTAHLFVLTLWPHLYWVVNEQAQRGYRPWGVGFRNQVQFAPSKFEPSLVRAGLWTQSALETIAARHKVHEGWNEQAVVRFSFGEREYQGTFVYELLQEWHRV